MRIRGWNFFCRADEDFNEPLLGGSSDREEEFCFNDLPNEIICHIAGYLELKNLLAFALTEFRVFEALTEMPVEYIDTEKQKVRASFATALSLMKKDHNRRSELQSHLLGLECCGEVEECVTSFSVAVSFLMCFFGIPGASLGAGLAAETLAPSLPVWAPWAISGGTCCVTTSVTAVGCFAVKQRIDGCLDSYDKKDEERKKEGKKIRDELDKSPVRVGRI